ncbi:hypothetical protein [Dactylosporangium sp. NPDC051484]|uniref:hypothetical protein n=1 Tax=Dactylosporangium sp. NPDC051484 TaxID=3154942 RepID=UPI00344B4624
MIAHSVKFAPKVAVASLFVKVWNPQRRAWRGEQGEAHIDAPPAPRARAGQDQPEPEAR